MSHGLAAHRASEKQAGYGSFGEPHLAGRSLEARPGREAHEDGQSTTPERRRRIGRTNAAPSAHSPCDAGGRNATSPCCEARLNPEEEGASSRPKSSRLAFGRDETGLACHCPGSVREPAPTGPNAPQRPRGPGPRLSWGWAEDAGGRRARIRSSKPWVGGSIPSRRASLFTHFRRALLRLRPRIGPGSVQVLVQGCLRHPCGGHDLRLPVCARISTLDPGQCDRTLPILRRPQA
jgi:hypothetical protein